MSKVKEVLINNPTPKHAPGYFIEVEWMIGDADGEERLEFGGFSENEKHLLYDAIETCERMQNAYPHGKGGYDGYEHIEGYDRWFDEDSDNYIEEYGSELSVDPGWYTPNSFEFYNVYYYDSNGKKYECNVVFDYIIIT